MTPCTAAQRSAVYIYSKGNYKPTAGVHHWGWHLVSVEKHKLHCTQVYYKIKAISLKKRKATNCNSDDISGTYLDESSVVVEIRSSLNTSQQYKPCN